MARALHRELEVKRRTKQGFTSLWGAPYGLGPGSGSWRALLQEIQASWWRPRATRWSSSRTCSTPSTTRPRPPTTTGSSTLLTFSTLETDYGVTCNHLTRVYDPAGKETCDDEGCPQGMLGKRHGTLRVSPRRSRFSKKLYVSTDLQITDLSGPREVFIGVMDVTHPDHIWGCAKMRRLRVKAVSALFNSDGVQGKITIQQASPFAPSDLTLSLAGLNGRAEEFHVHQMPFTAPQHKGHNVCLQTLAQYNPYKVQPGSEPKPGLGTHDQYGVGDLSGKHGLLTQVENLEATVTDYNLPIFGPRSVVGRSIVIKKSDNSTWVCGNLRSRRPVIRAAVVFRYPIVGEIMMEQDAEDPFEDTTLFVGPLVYSDGNHNTTGEHEFRIHKDPPGRDFYNWTGRCVSAGPRFNPYHVSVAAKAYEDCGPDMAEKCELGDLVGRNGPLQLAGTIQRADVSRLVLTDTNLPLQGRFSIIGHSIVISDKHAPEHRGQRMACTKVFRRYRHKGVVNAWSSTPGVGNLQGKIEFIQETPYDITNTEVNLSGLQGLAKKYHVHMVRVEQELEFPCAGSAVYGHFNPLGVVAKDSPPPGTGTHDLYELGDLSGKYGTLDGAFSTKGFYNDTNLPLFGHTSIMGRSVVIHKAEDDFRWFCGNIVWGYAPSEATQVSAIASFHHPQGYAWGYIRMRQLIYHDGSFGETFIEVSLRHPGVNNRNLTRGHNWSVYVNPVSVDASVKFFQSRCVAGGYRWNPYLIHLAQPNAVEFYDKECTPEFPLRCEVGDLSGRLGTIDLGDKKQVFVDSNLPLAGEQSAMRRSIVIHNERGRVERYACANIEPDDDIVKWANVRKTPRFSPISFMNTMREVLACPEWYLQMDLSTVTQSEDGECVSFLVHFMGPKARDLEQDFTRLLSGAVLSEPTIRMLGVPLDEKRKKKVSYKSCGGFDEEDQLTKENESESCLDKFVGFKFIISVIKCPEMI
ncbi:Superoxide dismutase (Cu-Zn)-like protein [Hyalella azteca]|uniref:Superoxide dismutase (Cu-Zn)-like protein n=1 Tax=Hyalella azteca TaxID=294128 RepID=A0A6A0HAZ4_HYAAZ|nr:Superoxide dismutase (Cu-Zn)-like protein [Hyalella azteca]